MRERGKSQGQHGGRHRLGDGIAALATSWLAYGSMALILTLAACSSTVIKRGQQFSESDLSQVQRGMSQEQVKTVLGTPATTAAAGSGNAYYYISSTMKESTFNTPQEVDRRVVAVYFAQAGTVDRVAHYGLKDGKVFDFISRTTPSANNREEGLLKAMFRNLGSKQLFGD
jgi:outer membrane protein assembly factor BamE (lipoprotein component of BamABCDE complex)